MHKKAKPILVVMLAMVLVTVTACSKPSADKEDKIVFAQSTDGLIYAPVYVARSLGYFEEEGLKTEFIITGGGSKVTAAVLGGSAQIGVTSLVNAMDSTKKGKPLQGFAALMNQYASNLVIKKEIAEKKGITESSPLKEKLEALKGLKIGITSPGSSTDKLIRLLLKEVGLQPDRDVLLVPIGKDSAMVAAFKNNKIDAFSLSSPTDQIAVEEGDGMILVNLSQGEVPYLDGITYTALVANKEYIEKNPETIKKVYRAMEKACQYIKNNKEGTRKILRSYFKQIDEDVFNKSFEANYEAFATSPLITKEGYEKNEIFSEIQGKKIDYQDVVATKIFK